MKDTANFKPAKGIRNNRLAYKYMYLGLYHMKHQILLYKYSIKKFK